MASGQSAFGGIKRKAPGFAAGVLSGAAFCVASGVVLLWAGVVGAGPLDPPAGPVAPTFKTLTEVEPRTAINETNTPGDADSIFRITQPGSYYLTSDITGAPGKSGIEIAASNVTVDLNGFSLIGGAGTVSAIATSGAECLRVRSGTIRGWGGSGVALPVAFCEVADVTVLSCGADGIVLGTDAIVRRCLTAQNAGRGIALGSAGLVELCESRSNGSDGINVGALAVVSRCIARTNAGSGIRAVSNGYSTIIENVCGGNLGDGIAVNGGCTVLRNNCAFNAGAAVGIRVTGTDNRIEDNLCTSNTGGIIVESGGNFIARNTCSGNGTNWNVAAGNTIFVVNSTPAGAFAGNAGGTAGSADPNANYSF